MSPVFGGHPFDRLDAARANEAEVARLRAHPAAGVLRLDGLDPVLDGEARLLFDPVTPGDRLLLLGLVDGAPAFVRLAPVAPAASRSRAIFGLLDRLDRTDAPFYATARGLLDWHARHAFCAACGSPTDIAKAGWCRRCPACAAEHFPRTDPVVIMLAEHDGDLLLGRQPRFPPGRYSALAGFVEPGESIEDAVARELHEEAGVRATAVRYVASQPWPFPSSLMIGCHALVDSRELVIDRTELDDAIWVTRRQVEASLAGDPSAPFLSPPPYAIAHDLLRWWLRPVADSPAST